MSSRAQEIMEQVRLYKEQHQCTHERCAHDRETARHMAESTLTVYRMATDLPVEQMAETLHGTVVWLEAFKEYNATVGDEDKVTLTDLQNAAKAALFVVGEELVQMQDMDIIR